MAIALNLTAPLRQDPDSQARLTQLVDGFAEHMQPLMDRALEESELVHFARVLVIDNRYIQVLTEFDGDPLAYTEFFRQKLGPVFEVVVSLVEGAPSWDRLDNPASFLEFMEKLNVRSLGASTVGNDGRGYLYSAIGETTVSELKARLAPVAS